VIFECDRLVLKVERIWASTIMRSGISRYNEEKSF
jgi:hypothetical protein